MGGINCNILVAFVCQLYPRASPSTLLAKFFRVYADWEWPKPVMLNQIMLPPPTAFSKKVVWNEELGAYHNMPIITPAYPAMNSAEKVCASCCYLFFRQKLSANAERISLFPLGIETQSRSDAARNDTSQQHRQDHHC